MTSDGAVIGVGEAMVEFAPVEGGLYRRGFAGDTFNTCWYLRRLVGQERPVAYLTRVGNDLISSAMVDFFAASGLDTSHIRRDSDRTLGLYLIELSDAERAFTYWRGQSAAKRLADRPELLAAAFAGAAMVYFSGITLAVIEELGRRNLLTALAQARAVGTKVAFDSNIRHRLWPDRIILQAALEAALDITDIALPSFDDETAVWGDADPEDTARRLAMHGVAEIVVKNGAGAAVVAHDDEVTTLPAAPAGARDTTGAGDSFNAAYLAARLAGLTPVDACRFGHALAAEVVCHPGALAPAPAIEPFRVALGQRAGSAAPNTPVSGVGC